MKLNENPLMAVVGVVLILVGALSFFNFRLFPTNVYMTIGVFVLAILVLLVVFMGRLRSNVGLIVLALWLGLMGAMSYFGLTFTYSDLILTVLPLGAGLFLLMGI